MSDKPIAVGDLVQVVRWGHEHRSKLGHIFRVGLIEPRGVFCGQCGLEIGCRPAIGLLGQIGVPAMWCKRIPPLDELESSKTDEPMKEPA